MVYFTVVGLFNCGTPATHGLCECTQDLVLTDASVPVCETEVHLLVLLEDQVVQMAKQFSELP